MNGYTNVLSNENVTMRDLVLSCARRFGTLDEIIASMRADSNTDHNNAARAAALWLAELLAMTPEQADDAAAKEHHKRAEVVFTCNEETARLRKRCDRIRSEVEAWSAQYHAELKTFVLEQLDEVLARDCRELECPPRKTGAAWLSAEIETVARDIERHLRDAKAVEQDGRKREEWRRTLLASMPGAPPDERG